MKYALLSTPGQLQTQLLLPQANFTFVVILYAAIILVLVIFVRYKRYARILKWICLSLLTYVIAGFIIPLDWRQVLLAAAAFAIYSFLHP